MKRFSKLTNECSSLETVGNVARGLLARPPLRPVSRKKALLITAFMMAMLGATPESAMADVFADADTSNHTLGYQPARMLYYYDEGSPDMFAAPGSAGFVNRYAQMVQQIDLFRQFLAVQSGGTFDLNMTYDQVKVGAGQTYTAGQLLGAGNPVLVNNAPGLSATQGDYEYHLDVIVDTPTSIVPPFGGGVGVVGGGYFWESSMSAGILYHEFGHNLGSGHDGALFQHSSSPGYTYDFATGAYAAASTSIGSTPWTNPIVSLPIGVYAQDGGNIFNRMAGGSPGTFDPITKGKFGWLKPSQFAKIGSTVAAGSTGVIKMYDASDLRLATQGSGDTLRYGVTQGYQEVPYSASVSRVAELFDTATGTWKPYKQRLDFYYQGENTHYLETYPASSMPNPVPGGIVVELNHRYVGTLKPGQVLDDRTLDMLIAVIFDGTDSGNYTFADYLTLKTEDPRDPSRIRPVHYELNFLNANNTDASGVFANLQVQALLDLKLQGSQWDPAQSGGSSTDGSGIWANSGVRWRNIAANGTKTAGQAWTANGDAIFGANSGVAGIVTLGSNVSAQSLTFAPVASGQYTIAQDAGNAFALTLGKWGVTAAESATIASKVTFGADQFWNVVDNKSLDLSGVVTAGGFNFYKFGQGTLTLSGASTWDKLFNVAEGTVIQTASQTIGAASGSGRELAIDSGTTYRITGGTLTLSDGAKVSGAEFYAPSGTFWKDSPNFHGNGVLRLSRTDSTLAAPEIVFSGSGRIESDMLQDAGMHVIQAGGSNTISGNISGAGGIQLSANSNTRSLTLTGKNTFTGDLLISRGILAVGTGGTLSGTNKLTFDTASGQSGEFRTGPADRTLTSLSTAGTNAGTATVSNSSTTNAILTVNQSTNTTYSGAISDGGTGTLALNKTGTGTLALTGGLGTYSGGTTVTQGMLRIGGSGAIGTGAVTLAGGTLSVDQRQGLNLTRLSGASMNTGPVSGGAYTSDFSPLHTPSSNIVNGTFAYTGKIYLTTGTWSFGESFDDGAYLKINGTQILNNASYSSTTYGNVVIGADGWYDIDLRVFNTGGGGPYATGSWDNVKGIGIKQGAQTTNGLDYTAFNPGALGIKLRDINTVANAVNLTADSTVEILDADGIQAETLVTGLVSGAGALTKTGTGILTLGNSGNSYTGAVTVTGGTLAAGAANALSAGSAITLANSSGVTLDLRGFNQTIASLAGGGASGGDVLLGSATLTTGGNNTSTVFAGDISGTGGLSKAGTGTMSLSGQNTYTGATTVTGGTLNLDYSANALTSNLVNSASALVLDGGTLSVTGRSGATISQSFASLTVVDGANGISLAQNGAASLDVNVGAINRTGAGTIDFSGLTGAAVGARIITTSGTAGNLLDGGAQWATYNGTDWASRDAAGNIVAYAGYFDVPTSGEVAIRNNAADNTRIYENAGAGNVSLESAGTTTINSLLMAGTATATTVDLTGKTLSVAGIAAGVNAKRLTLGTAADAGTVTSGTNAIQFLSNAASPSDGIVVNSTLANNGATPLAVSVSGGVNGGSTYFAGTNTYTGGTTVTNNGVLHMGAGGATGTLGSGAVTVTAGASLIFDRSNTATVANLISGAGAVTKVGANTIVLTGANTYSGVTTISAGTLQVGNGGTTGSLGTGAIVDNGILAFNRSDAVTLANVISGSGSLTQSGTGTTILTGANTYSGGTTLTAGTLQIGNGGTTGSLGTGAVTGTGGTLAFNRSDSFTFAPAISGGVSFAHNGPGTIILTGANSYTGTTTVASGTLQIGDGGTTGSFGSGAVTNNGTLLFKRSDTLTVSSVIGGAGSLRQDSTGTLVLTGANNYSGTTTVNAGTLRLDTGGRLGTGAATVSSTLVFNGADTVTAANAFGGAGDIVQAGTGKTILIGNNALFTGTATIADGTLQIGNGGTTGDLSSATIVNNAMLTFDRSDTVTPLSIITGTGSLTQAGTGTLVLAGNNTYTGSTIIETGGTLQVGNAGTSGTFGTGPVIDNGTLIFNRTNNFTVSGAISGAGKVVQAGTGTTTLAGANTYAGGTDINAGALKLLVGSSLGSGVVAVNSGGNLQFGTGGVDGVNFTLANNFALNGGKLSFNSWFTTVTLNGAINTGTGATIDCLRGDSVVLNGLVTGSGPISITGGAGGTFGTVVFNNAANTYSGTVNVVGGSTTSPTTSSVNVTLGNATALSHATLNLAPVGVPASSQVAYASGLTAATIGGLSGSASGRLQLQNGSTPFALTVDQAANTTFAGVASGTGSLNKAGAGTLTLSGQNTYTGGTVVTGGVLNLDFSAAGAPATNILAAAGPVTLNGGTLRITGKSGQNGTVQTFAGLSSGTAASTLQLVRNGATTLDVNVGALSFGAGTITFSGLTGTAAGARVITTTNAGPNDGSTQLSGTSALWFGADSSTGWASVQSVSGVNYIVKWTGTFTDVYTNTAGGKTIVIPNAGANGAVRILENGPNTTHNTLAAASTTINSLLMTANVSSSTIDMGAADKLTILGSGNIAMASDAKSLTIGQTAGQGTLTAGNAGAATLNLSNANAASLLTVNANIADNGVGAVSLATAGAVTLNGALSYTGSTTVGIGSTLTANSLFGGGTYAGAIANNGVLNMTAAGAQTLSGALSGTGIWNNTGTGTTTVAGVFGGSATWNQTGSGSTVFTGANTNTGPINIAAGTVTLGGAGRFGGGNYAGTITNNGSLIIGTSASQTLSGTIAGTGAVTISKTGSDLVLTGNNSYTGGTTITSGTVRTVNSGTIFGTGTVTYTGNATLATDSGSSAVTIANAIAINSGVTTTLDAGYANLTLSGIISGAGNLRQNSSGTLTLAGANTYAGNTTVSSAAGNLLVTGVLGVGNYAGAIANAGTVTFASASNQTLAGVISGAGTLTQAGTGTLTLTGTNTYAGATAITSGTLQVGTGGTAGTLGGTGDIANNGTLAFNRSDAVSLARNVTGTGALTQAGAGTLVLTGTNTYTGATTIAAGTLQVGTGGTAGTLGGSGDIVDNGTLVFNRSDAVSLARNVTGTGALTQSGTGTLTLTGTNTYSGATTIAAGTVQVGTGGTVGTLGTGAVANAGALVFNRSDALTAVNAISGAGSLTQSGTGTLTLSGASTYTGATVVSAGTLNLTGSLANTAMTVASGATLTGSGSTLGTVSILAGGNLAGAQGGTLTTGALTLANTSNINVGLATPSTTPLFQINGNLTLDGIINIQSTGAFGPGVYRVMNYTGAFTDNTATIGSVPLGSSASDYAVQTAVPNQVNIVNLTNAQRNFWDGPVSAANSAIEGGSATWNATNSNWTDGAGATNGTQSAGFLVFQGTGGTVTVDNTSGQVGGAGREVNGMQFAVNGYTITGGSIALTNDAGSGDSVLRVGDGTGAGASIVTTVGSALTGTANVRKTDLGTLVLTGTNTYTGTTTIASGTVQVGAGGAAGTLGGTGDIANNGALAFNRSDAVTLARNVTGTGALTQAGTGTLTLSGTNTYTGATTITAGTVQVGTGGTAGTLGGSGNIANNGTLAFNRSDAVDLARNVTGTGALTQAGGGTLTLSGTSTYTGATTVSAGTLALTGSLGNTAMTVASGATLTGSGSTLGAVSILAGGNLTGAQGGTLTTGALTLANTSNLNVGLATPSTTPLFQVNGNLTFDGIINIQSTGAFGPGVYRILNYTGTFTDNTATIGSVPLGSSASDYAVQTAVPNQVNIVNLTNAQRNFWDGPVSAPNNAIEGGTAIWNTTNSNWTDGAGAVNGTQSAGFLVFQGTGGTVTVDNTAGQVGGAGREVTGMQFAVNGYTITGGSIALTNDTTSGDAVLRVGDGTGAGAAIVTTVGSALTGAANVRKTDLGTLVLTGTNTYTGTTTIGSGTVQVGAGGAAGTLGGSGDIANNGTLVFNRSDAVALARNVTGSGALTQSGAGTLTLTGTNTYSGATTITSGTLQVGTGGIAGTLGGSGDIANAGTLVFNRSDAVDLARNVTGTGALTQSGAGTLTLTGTNTYTGATTIAAGTMQVGTGGTAGTLGGSGDVANNGTLVFNRSDVVDLDRNVTGAGALTQSGTGTLTLTGTNTYTGATTIAAGTLQVGVGGTAGTLGGSGDIANAGTLVFNRSDTVDLDRNVTGSGALTQSGAGTLTLTGTNTYTGATTIAAGTLQVGDGGTAGTLGGSGDIANNGTLAFNRSDAVALARNVTGTGALTQAGTGTLTLTGTNTYSGGTAINDGTLAITADANLGDAAGGLSFDGGTLRTEANLTTNRTTVLNAGGGTIDTFGFDSSFNGLMTGTGALTIDGTGSVTLGGANDYTGGTTVKGGATVAVNSDSSLGAAAGDLTLDNGTLRTLAGFTSAREVVLAAGGGTVDTNGFDTVQSGVISGPGALTKNGNGKLTLTADNTFGGTTTINAGSLQIGNGGTTGSLAGNVVNHSELIFNRSDAMAYDGHISGNGIVSQVGSGTTVLNGTSTMGILKLNAGTLALGPAASVTTGAFTQLAGATLSLDVSSPGTPLKITGDASFGGTISLANANTLSGQVNRVLLDIGGTTNGSFSAPEGTVLGETGSYRYVLSYMMGDGNDIGIMAIPLVNLAELLQALENPMRVGQDSALGIMNDMEDRVALHRRIGFFEDSASGSGSVAATLERSAGLPEGISASQFDFDGDAAKHGMAYTNSSYGQFDYDGGLSGATQRYKVGYDALLRRDAWVGADFSYSTTDWHQGTSSGDLDAYRLSLYGSWEMTKGWFLDAGLGAGLLDFSTERSGGQKGDFSGWDSYAFTRIAWRAIDQQQNGVITRLEPFVGLRGVHTALNGYTEKGPTPLAVGGQSSNLGQAFVGVTWSQWFDAPQVFGKDTAWGYHLRLQGFVGAGNQTQNSSVLIIGSGSTPSSVSAADFDRWGGHLTLGTDYRIGDWTISADVSASESENTEAWQTKLNVSWWW